MYFSPTPAIFGQPPDCCGCPKTRATSSCLPWLRYEVAAVERQQPFPMPLGGGAVVNRPLRKREAVMERRINLRRRICAFHLRVQLFDDLRRRVDIGLGAAEIQFGPGLARGQM